MGSGRKGVSCLCRVSGSQCVLVYQKIEGDCLQWINGKEGISFHQRGVIQGNLDAFWRTPRTLLMMVFIVCCCFLTVRGYATGLARKNYTMNMEESIAWFLMTGFNSFNLTSVTFLIMVSELPRRIPFQQYTLIRSTRVRWIVAQMLYCLLLVVLMLVVLIALTALMSPRCCSGQGWSDNVRIAAGEILELSYCSAWFARI